MSVLILVRGAGDLASGVALRLHRSGFQVIMTELPHPLVVRRMVSFAEAVYRGEFEVEGVVARRIDKYEDAYTVLGAGMIPILIDPEGGIIRWLNKQTSTRKAIIIIDARMLKQTPDGGLDQANLVIGIGPGFTAGWDCHAVIETNRGHFLGRVIWDGSAQMNTGIPESVGSYGDERVIRAPADGRLRNLVNIGEHIISGQIIAEVGDHPVKAPFDGVLRGLLYPGVLVTQGTKIGDLDPRNDSRYCWLVSDKSLAVGGGVLEAILASPNIRQLISQE